MTTTTEIQQRIEFITQRREQGTATLRKFWNAGELSKDALPCSTTCTGHIAVNTPDGYVKGNCPVHLKPGVCPLVEKNARELTARLVRAGFGKRYHNPLASKIRAMKAVQEFMAHLTDHLTNGRGMVVTGDVGVGKTMMLAYLAKEMLDRNIGVWKVHVPELIRMLESKDQKAEAVQRCITVQVLMLDDIGSGEMDNKVLGMFEGIVEHRHGNKMSTFVTTNMTREQLVENVPLRRMVDRWRETNMMVRVAGESQRHS